MESQLSHTRVSLEKKDRRRRNPCVNDRDIFLPSSSNEMTQSPCFSVGQKPVGFLDVSTLNFPRHHRITRGGEIVAHRR